MAGAAVTLFQRVWLPVSGRHVSRAFSLGAGQDLPIAVDVVVVAAVGKPAPSSDIYISIEASVDGRNWYSPADIEALNCGVGFASLSFNPGGSAWLYRAVVENVGDEQSLQAVASVTARNAFVRE
jgi:hypothetical protein